MQVMPEVVFFNNRQYNPREGIPGLDILLVVVSIRMKFLAPQNSVIYDKRSLDFWHSLENFRHSLGVEYMISGFSLSGVCSIYFQLRRTGL
ncbi:hypothetical protein RhiirA1_473008 [Rhizophagus irregularis]|uniref:Uncharacterized protein n=1 Tax=Rhizophagus irregularis TaxID=588596 RepID=A0A2N0R1E7_9GLOM|nr:hypothetical protein RhiirA1_473008 [Rhizophagus irregularis]